MQETYENLLPISRLLNLGDNYNLSDLAVDFQKTADERIFSKIFCDLFYFTKGQLNKYFNLTEEDKISFALLELNNAIRDYDPTKGASIQTLYNTYLNRKLYAESSMMNHHVRKINHESQSYDALTEIMGDSVDSIDNFSNIELFETLKQLNLSERETSCCRIITNESHDLKDTEIGRRMNATSAGVAYIKKKLKIKLAPLVMA